MPCWYQASMQIIAVVAFGNGREAYPSQHKSQVRCPWDNLTWKILLCPRISVSQHCKQTALQFWQDAPVCFHHPALKYCLTAYFHLSLEWLLLLLSHGKGEGRVCFREPEIWAGFAFWAAPLPLLAAVTWGHCVCEQRFVFHDAGTVYWQPLTAHKPLCAAARIASALKTSLERLD